MAFVGFLIGHEGVHRALAALGLVGFALYIVTLF
jgi:hypothetical protein